MKKAFILIFVICLGAAASYFFADEWERMSREKKEAAMNDSIATRVNELMAAADSLESIANEGRESDDRMGCAYIEALKSLREAQATAQKAKPAMPNPVDPAREKRLTESLQMIDTILKQQLLIVDGMPYAEKQLKSRIAAIDSLTK